MKVDSLFSKIRTALRIVCGWVLHGVSLIIPKDDDLWVFMGWRFSKDREVFAENVKYFFLYVHHQQASVVRPVWIGADRAICSMLRHHGYEAYWRGSLRGMWLSMRAGYSIVGAFLTIEQWRCTGGSKVVQLWHGKSIKKTGEQSRYGRAGKNKGRWAVPGRFVRFHVVAAVSEYLATYTSKDFGIGRERLLVSGIPKYDVLSQSIEGAAIDLDTDLEQTLDTIRTKHPRRIILYGPTFRPDGSSSIDSIDFEALDRTLAKHNDFVVVSLHPKFAARDWIPNIELQHVFFSQGDRDKYPLLREFDYILTDYSSLAMDFLYMNKLPIHYVYDFDTYTQDMGVYEDLWELMPGPKAFSFPELLEVLEGDLSAYEKKIPSCVATLALQQDGSASERIFHYLHSDTQ
jgi:CDP-glycerol glycerophosphotransferase